MADTITRIPARARDTKVATVKAGEIWQFEADGVWDDWYVRCGPDGYRNFLLHVLDIWPRFREAPYFCVVGQIEGDDASMFRIGRGTTHRFDQDGQLLAFANDHPAAYSNNAGEVTLRARRLSEPPPSANEEPLEGWALARQVLDRTAGAGFVAALVIGVSLALALTPQGRDVVRIVGEDSAFGSRQILFMLSLFFLAMQAWFWPRTIINFQYGSDRQAWRPRGFLEWMPRLLGATPFVLTILTMVRNPASNSAVATIVLVVGLAYFVIVLVRQDVRRLNVRLRTELAEAVKHKAAGSARGQPARLGRAWVVAGLGLAAASMLLFCIDPVTVPRILGPPAVVFLGVGLLIPPLVILIQCGASARFPSLLILLALALLFSFWLDNHQVGRRARHTPLQASIERPSLDQAYARWKAQFPAGGPLSMVLVADEGGASRAGYWTGEVLSALERDSGGAFSQHLFAINSVSGGSVGAIGYVAALDEMPDVTAPRPASDFIRMEARIQDFTGADALSPVTAAMLFPDLLQRFVPFNLPTPDRAEALERGWETAWAAGCPARSPCKPGLLSGAFLDLWRKSARRWTPAVIINGASEETGRRILTTPIVLPLLEVGASDDGAIDADDFHEIAGADVRASTAIHNGARFPYVSPAGTLPAGPRGVQHIVDGGYFDAAGIESTRQLAITMAKLAAKAADDLTITVVFIGYDTPEAPPAKRLAGNEVLAPVVGLFGSRGAHQTHMWRQLAGTARRPEEGAIRYNRVLLRDDPKCQKNARRPFQDPFTTPMDWALSEHAKILMRWNMGFSAIPWPTQDGCRDDHKEIADVLASMDSPQRARAAPR